METSNYLYENIEQILRIGFGIFMPERSIWCWKKEGGRDSTNISMPNGAIREVVQNQIHITATGRVGAQSAVHRDRPIHVRFNRAMDPMLCAIDVVRGSTG